MVKQIKIFGIFLGLILPISISFASNIAETHSQSRRIFLLESALAPANPKAVINTWLEAVKNRNGAVQYMLLCSELQKANLNNLEALNWVTGVSSPWISGYKIISQKTNGDISKFTVQYQFSLSTGIVGNVRDHINIVPINAKANSSQQYCINQLDYLSPVDKI